MELEERVQVVEKDVRDLHQYAQATHAEREGWYNEFRDARAEVRGWAEFAVKANNKVDKVAEFYKDVEGEVKEVKSKLTGIEDRLGGIDTRLDGIDTRLDGIDTRLDGVDTRLDGVDTRLGGIDSTLKEHGDTLAEHDRRFDRIDATLGEHGERLDSIQSGLRQQSSMLRQLLEKVG